MKIVKKNFLLTSSIIFVVVTVVLASLYFAMPIYYEQVKSQEAKHEFEQVTRQIQGKSIEEMKSLLTDYSHKNNRIWFNLTDAKEQVLYPNVEVSETQDSLQLTILPTMADSTAKHKSMTQKIRSSDVRASRCG